MRKLFRTIALCTVALGFLTGCGETNKAEVGTPENPYEIVWYNFSEDQSGLAEVQAKANEYLIKKIGVKLNITMSMGDYDKKMSVIQASGDPFDLSFTCSWTNTYNNCVAKGFFTPLNDPKDNLLEKYGQGILKDVNPAFIKGSQIDGINYAVPTNKEAATQLVFQFNKKYVDKYNFDLSKVKSMKDLAEMFKVIKEKEPGIIPFNLNQGTSYVMGDMDFIISSRIPGMVVVEDGNHKVVNQFENKEFLEHIKLYRDYYEKGYIPSDVAIRKADPGFAKTGKWFCNEGEYAPYADVVWSIDHGFPIVSVPAFSPPLICTRSVTGAMTAISSTSERPDLCMKFLNLLNTDHYLRNLLGYGIEGKQYKKLPNGKIKLLPASIDYRPFQFTLGNMFILDVLKNEPKDKWEEYNKWNNSAIKSPILGFAFDSTPVKNEMMAVQNISEEYCKGIFTGAYDPDKKIPEMLNKMRRAGMEKILAEMQKQIDKWWSITHKE